MASSTLPSCKAPLSIRPHNAGSASRANAAASARSPSWWAPLFNNISSQPDYIDASEGAPPADQPPLPTRRFAPFTEEKARVLRKKMLQTQTYHDAMYHSAIASRLASDTTSLP